MLKFLMLRLVTPSKVDVALQLKMKIAGREGLISPSILIYWQISPNCRARNASDAEVTPLLIRSDPQKT